ncbi:MAG TPA: putative molybdenum carrier protein [Syntrophorhabdus sp.]|nr:putative molybdenum carrier protein [Syntrophorhabdus sp.]
MAGERSLGSVAKIVSGGQTGADRAALDFAISRDIPHGGWLPKGRKTEDGKLPETYQLQEMPSAAYSKRTKKNIQESDATLIISHGVLTGGSALTQCLAQDLGKPYLHVDLNLSSVQESARVINAWIRHHDIRVLNIAGPRSSKDPKIYEQTMNLLERAFLFTEADAK